MDWVLYKFGEYIFHKNNFDKFEKIFDKNFEIIFSEKFILKNNFEKINLCENISMIILDGPTYHVIERSDNIEYVIILEGDETSQFQNKYVKYFLKNNFKFFINLKNQNIISKISDTRLVMVIIEDDSCTQPYTCQLLPPSLDPFLRPSVS